MTDDVSTSHVHYTRATGFKPGDRPESLPELTADDFCKGRYSHKDQRCYTARLLDIFLSEDRPFVAAYKEFRLATMDYLYEFHRDDHAQSAADRAKCFNTVARRLDYRLVPKEANHAQE